MGDPRIHIVTQPNAGAHVALNRGIAETEGFEYVTILNSDDCYHSGRIEKCLGFLKGHPERDMVFTGLQLIDAGSRKLDASEPRAKWFDAVWSLAKDDLPLAEWLGIANFAATTSNLFARRAYLLAHPFAPYRYTHDYHSLITCALFDRLELIPEELLYYRVHPENTISTRPELLIREMLRMNLDLLRELAPRLSADPRLRQAFAQYERAAWNNVSAFPAGVFHCLLAGAVAAVEPARLDSLLEGVGAFPEAERFPNRSEVLEIVTFVGQSRARVERSVWMRHVKLLAAIARSGWISLGSLLGPARRLARDEGKTAEEKHRALVARLRGSGWMRLGCRLGIKSARAVIDLCETPK